MSEIKSRKDVNLLLLTEGDKQHCILIKSLPAFLRLRTKYLKKMHTYEKCFRRFTSLRMYNKHATFCATGKPAIHMPEEPVVKFKNFQRKFPCSAVMYANFDAMLNLTNVELELLTEEEMYEFYEKG